jgi:uncharacterized protein (UPF0332 family)
MTWIEIGKNHLRAAKLTLEEYPRTCISRAYYAAQVVLAESLLRAGFMPAGGRQTPGHGRQPELIGSHLAGLGGRTVKEMRSIIRRLYRYRLDADYKRTVTIDRARAVESVRDASAMFRLLGCDQ